ncbi:MAG: hypothetical protein KA004_05350 [Verrucomicrobiales bacterium]|nr:hypothetical protein [Verrucomicrobiales bacterium]
MRPHLLLIFLTIATGWVETTSLGGDAVANGRVHEQPTPSQDAAGPAPVDKCQTIH